MLKIEPVEGGQPLPVATHTGILKIGDAEIPCYVLNDGRRLLSGRAVTKAMGLTGRGPGMDRFLSSKSLRPYISDKLEDAILNPVDFKFKNGASSPAGYGALILPELCHAVMDAEEALALPANQKGMARKAKILSRGFSTVGIMALIDEATGYQEDRAKDALADILNKYISEELSKWVKMFPDEYYRELFRLRGLTYSEFTSKRPIIIAKLTKDIVYDRLAPGVTEALEGKNPKDEHGHRKDKHHQWLTPDAGQQKLKEHLASVIALMKASGGNNAVFNRLLQRALPRWRDQLQGKLLDVPQDDE